MKLPHVFDTSDGKVCISQLDVDRDGMMYLSPQDANDLARLLQLFAGRASSTTIANRWSSQQKPLEPEGQFPNA